MHDQIIAPRVVAVCTSNGGIPKLPRSLACVSFAGLAGDEHNHAKHNNRLQAVSLQDIEVLEDLAREGYPLRAGTTGENLVVRGLGVNKLGIGSILEFPGGVILELTKVRQPCYVLDSIDPRLKEAILGRCGFYAKVLREGLVQAGDGILLRETAALF
jgi:molybdopterin adenylyltransferase